MNIFISGGCKNGKSFFAQRLAKEMAKKERPLYYIATMDPHDEEDEARIARHRDERSGWGFETVEQPRDLCGCLDRAVRSGVFLLDSVTAIMANEMFPFDGKSADSDGSRTADDLCRFAEKTGNTVFVSDFIYSDAAFYDEATENYRRALAMADRRLASICERVYEVSFGNTLRLK